MTLEQARVAAMMHGAALHSTKAGVEWWRLPNGDWLALLPEQGQYTVRAVTKEACGCG